VKFIFESSHGGRTGNIFSVNQHGRVEVAIGEHLGDVVEVTPNLIAAPGVTRVVGADFDYAAVIVKFKVMGGFVVREAHYLVAVLIDHGVMILLGERQECP